MLIDWTEGSRNSSFSRIFLGVITMRGSSPFFINSNWLWTRRRPSSYIHVQVSNPLTVSNRALLAMSIYPQVSLQNTHTPLQRSFDLKCVMARIQHSLQQTSFFLFLSFFPVLLFRMPIGSQKVNTKAIFP